MVHFLLLLMWDYDHGTLPPSLNVGLCPCFATMVHILLLLMWDYDHGTLPPSLNVGL